MKKEYIAFIVEDNEIETSIIKKIIQSNKSIVDCEFNENGLIALEKLQQLITSNEKLPAFILLDFNMPVMNGLKFLEKIKDIESINKIPIFINSSSVEIIEYHVLIENKNLKQCFSKPFSNLNLNTILNFIEK